MFRIGSAQLWVKDQEEALEFWTKKVGMEVSSDVTMPEMGDFRWLAVSPPGQPEVSIVLMAIPGHPMMDDVTTEKVHDLVGMGYAGSVFLIADDCRGAAEDLKGRGVVFSEEPEDRPYGIDAGFRDPSGNSIRLTQVKEDF